MDKILYVPAGNDCGEAEGRARRVWQQRGLDVFLARTGGEALKVLAREKSSVTIIVADPDVPDMSRDDFLRSIRQNSGARLVLSATTGANLIDAQMRENYGVERVFPWDAYAWAYVLDEKVDGRPAEEYEVK